MGQNRNESAIVLRPGRGGFTLIELLVVIAIISLLVSILLPSLLKAKELAKRAVCMSNLHQISLSYIQYEHEHQAYPYRGWCWPNTVLKPSDGGWEEITFDLWDMLQKYASGSAELFYCPDGAFRTGYNYEFLIKGPKDYGGWYNPWTRALGDYAWGTYTLFLGNVDPGNRFLPIPADVASKRVLSLMDVTRSDECPLASDLTFWDPFPTMHNHPIWDGYPASEVSPIYEGQNTVFVDGHVEWRDAQIVIEHHAKYGGIFLY